MQRWTGGASAFVLAVSLLAPLAHAGDETDPGSSLPASSGSAAANPTADEDEARRLEAGAAGQTLGADVKEADRAAQQATSDALDPELLFLDEPTSGLDPASSAGVDDLIRRMHTLYGLTIVLITHDLDLMWQVCDRVAVIGERKVLAVGSMQELSQHPHPIVRGYFDDPRARKARKRAQE